MEIKVRFAWRCWPVLACMVAPLAAELACTGDDPVLSRVSSDAGTLSDVGAIDSGSEAAPPVLPLKADRIASITIGGAAACVITRDDKALWCIGRVEEGENLRAPTTGDIQCKGNNVSLWRGSPRFEHIPIGPVDQVAVSLRSRCVIQSGKIRCWGGNRVGELGHTAGTAGDVECGTNLTCNSTPQEPVNLPSGVSFVEIVAGNRAFCARTAEGGVFCWGDNLSSQTAAPASPTTLPHPVDLGGARASALAMGLSSSCAALQPSGVMCWGANAVMGDDAGATVAFPRRVAAANGVQVRELDVNDRGGCVLNLGTGASPLCWGNNGSGLLAGSPVADGSRIVSEIPGGAAELHVGELGAAVRIGSAVWTWGEGRRGGLANGELTDGGGVPPAARPPLDGASRIAFGFEKNGMAIRGNEVLAWGPNTCGQLGHAPGVGDVVCERNDPCSPVPVVVPLP